MGAATPMGARIGHGPAVTGDARLPMQLAVSRPTHTVAVRNQLSVYDWEDDLVAAGRVGHPTIAWWHGYRMTPVAFGAFCYVCDTLICSWSRRWPITNKAKTAIEDHKMAHRAQMVSARISTK